MPNPITGSPFQIETTAGSNGLTQLNLSARDTFSLNGPGLAAVVNQVNTYLSSSKCTSILRLAPQGNALLPYPAAETSRTSPSYRHSRRRG